MTETGHTQRKSGDEDDPVLVSALNHYLYCPRQCALIFLEQTFTDNLLTVRGRALHRQVDDQRTTTKEGVAVEHGLPLYCDRLGLVGKADVVEFHDGVPYPVEYKHGKKRRWENLDVQVCAQALCLEEMFHCQVPRGAIYHISSRRRREVPFTDHLRRLTEETVEAVRRLLASDRLPPPLNDARCRQCSLLETCAPQAVAERTALQQVLDALFVPEEGPI